MLKQTPPKAYLRATVTLPLTPVEHFFDIEVDPIRDICYLHGIVERHDGNSDAERFVFFFAPEETLEAEQNAFAQAYAFLSQQPDADLLLFEIRTDQYRKLQAKYPDVCSAEDIEQLFDPAHAIDLYRDVVIKATEWPTRDHSIKTLAKHLGFAWRDVHPSGAA